MAPTLVLIPQRMSSKRLIDFIRFPAVTSRLIPIALAVSAFVLTIAFEMWHSDKEGKTGQTPVAAAARPFAGSVPLADAPAAGPPRQTGVSAAQPAAAARGNTAAPDVSSTQPTGEEYDPGNQAVPAIVSHGPMKNHSGDVTTIRNLSGVALNVTVTAIGTGGQSEIQMVLAPHAKKDLEEAGLIVEPPARITVASPPYADRLIELE
jgi:hypothetical protein